MNWMIILNLACVLLLGLLWGLSELIARYNDTKYILRVWQSYMYIALNGIISILAYFILKYFKNENLELIDSFEINNIVISGLGGMMILRSSFFSVKIKETKVDVGFGTIAQIFLDLIERKMKNSAAAIKIEEINSIMKDVLFEDAKDELSTICINSIDNFSKDDSEKLVKRIEEISITNISNTNKVIQLGINISRYCDNAILKKAIEVLGLKKNKKASGVHMHFEINDLDFYLNKLKKNQYGTK